LNIREDPDELASSSTAVSTGGDTSAAPTPDGNFPSRTRKLRYAPGTDGRRRADLKPQAEVRYWSEYDHPEEDDGEEGYFIYVNPDEDEAPWIPFKDSVLAIYNGIKRLFTGKKEEVSPEMTEAAPLLRPDVSMQSSSYTESATDGLSEETSSSSETSDSDSDIFIPRTRYGTLPVSQAAPSHTLVPDHVNILIASMVSLFFSTTLSLVLLVLSAVGRKRARGEVDIVLLIGSAISVIFAIGGLWGLVGRRAGPFRWTVGILVFTGVLLIDGLLVGRLFRDLQAEWSEISKT